MFNFTLEIVALSFVSNFLGTRRVSLVTRGFNRHLLGQLQTIIMHQIDILYLIQSCPTILQSDTFNSDLTQSRLGSPQIILFLDGLVMILPTLISHLSVTPLAAPVMLTNVPFT